jgi:hypothetical protein
MLLQPIKARISSIFRGKDQLEDMVGDRSLLELGLEKIQELKWHVFFESYKNLECRDCDGKAFVAS